MPIEFPCQYCRENIRVPDWGEGRRTQCPVCRRVLSIPAGHSVPKRPIQMRVVASEFDATRRLAEDQARRRLRTPVNACQGLLVLMILGSMASAVALLTSLLEGDYEVPSYSVTFFWISVCLVQSILGVVGIYGLQQALNLNSRIWSWTGVWISIVMGMLYVVMLPFAIWIVMVLRKPEVLDLFQTARGDVRGMVDAD